MCFFFQFYFYNLYTRTVVIHYIKNYCIHTINGVSLVHVTVALDLKIQHCSFIQQ